MKRLIRFVIWIGFLGVLFLAFTNLIIVSSTSADVITEIEEVNSKKVALVFGTSKSTRSGEQNPFFKDRKAWLDVGAQNIRCSLPKR